MHDTTADDIAADLSTGWSRVADRWPSLWQLHLPPKRRGRGAGCIRSRGKASARMAKRPASGVGSCVTRLVHHPLWDIRGPLSAWIEIVRRPRTPCPMQPDRRRPRRMLELLKALGRGGLCAGALISRRGRRHCWTRPWGNYYTEPKQAVKRGFTGPHACAIFPDECWCASICRRSKAGSWRRRPYPAGDAYV